MPASHPSGEDPLPSVWTVKDKKTRIVCITLGHDDKAHDNKAYQALLVNAVNDPFLGPDCYPREEAAASDVFHFEAPEEGGHVGFSPAGGAEEYWSESRAIGFLNG